MDNLLGTMYLDISERIKARVPEIKWIDQDFGQLEYFEIRPAVSFPCVLIDFGNINYSNISSLAQLADIKIMIRMGFAPFANSNGAAPMNVREKALEYYNIEQKVYVALQGWQTEYFQPLIRESAGTEQRDQDAAALRVRVITFSTSLEDETAIEAYTKHTAKVKIETEIYQTR